MGPSKVRVVIDGIGEAGRHLLRGVMRYARNNTAWHLRVEMDPAAPKGADWEEDDATIYASVRGLLLLDVMRRGRPIINCLAHHEPLGVPTIRVNDLGVGELAAEYLLQKGFERFIFFSGKDTSPAAELRYAGFARRLLRAGHVVLGRELMGLPQHVINRVVELIERTPKPLAMLVSHDTLAREVTDYIASANIAVPEQVAILGVDDDELQSEISRPPLSSVQIPYAEIGHRAAAALDAHLRGEDLSHEPVLIEPVGVVTRQSTNIYAVDEPRLAEALRYIREHACDPCSVKDVLEHVAVSRRWLESQFRQRFAHTPHDAITQTRIDRARELLRDPHQTLRSVAEKSGYAHVQNFVGAFRHATGETPAVFRARMRIAQADIIRRTPVEGGRPPAINQRTQ